MKNSSEGTVKTAIIGDMNFAYIPPGEFWMGSSKSEVSRHDDEKLHGVRLTKGFYMQTTPVTQGQWEAVMGSNPSWFKKVGPTAPVEYVSWNDVHEFIGRINELDSENNYRLPTEAEWEYACRAGTETAFYSGPITDLNGLDPNLDKVGWFRKNSGGTTHPVGQKEPNAWGLYDMHGNVWEWCSDWYGDYPTGPVTDPTGPEIGYYRVLRGGSWLDSEWWMKCRSAFRNHLFHLSYQFNCVGFRLVMDRCENRYRYNNDLNDEYYHHYYMDANGMNCKSRNHSKPNNGDKKNQHRYRDTDTNIVGFENDYAGWLQESARFLREGRFNLENVAEELEAMGRSQKRELISRFAVLIAHLLKWRHQPDKRSKSRERTIRVQRMDIGELLEESPSLRHEIEDRIDRAYQKARVFAESETGIDFHRFPERCPFSMGQLLDDGFFPLPEAINS